MTDKISLDPTSLNRVPFFPGIFVGTIRIAPRHADFINVIFQIVILDALARIWEAFREVNEHHAAESRKGHRLRDLQFQRYRCENKRFDDCFQEFIMRQATHFRIAATEFSTHALASKI